MIELATAFNRMSLALRASQEMLESRIAEGSRELRDSQEFLELLLDSIDQRVVVVNAKYEIIKANAAAMRMHGRELVGARCCEVFEGLSDPPEDYPARRTFETGRPASDERSQRTVRGQEAVYVETYPVLDAAEGVESVVEIGRVVSAEKQLQMQMVYQERMAAFGQLAAGVAFGQLAAGVAHEIGNPLAAIESQLQLAQGDPSRVEQTLGVVRKQVGRMARMLRELVEFTRRRRDEVMLASANQVAEDVARLLEHDPRARRVKIVRRLAENLPGIRTQQDHLVQVLLNLGLNALDAMPETGTVEFVTGVENGQVTIRVRDTGGGITEKARARLFEPFYTTKGPGRGTGLGLFVSKGIVEAMGGVLELERTGPEGTTFVVRLTADGVRPDGADS
jgi:signal transduction histidine kinase